jgi:hypothetical protein
VSWTTLALCALLLVHGALHVLGFAKAFALLDLPALSGPISRPLGVVWFCAAVLLLASAVALFVAPRHFWIIAAPALLLSQAAIIASWDDAKFGTLLNAVALIPVVLGALEARPTSYRSQFRAETRAASRTSAPPAALDENDLARLPPPVAEYVRRSGAVGKPKVRGFRAEFRGRIRAKPEGGWMKFRAEQQNTFAPRARWFLIESSLFGLPFTGLHRYTGPHATMQVKALSLFSVVDAAGPKMDQSETVTMLNDMCVLSPGALIDPAIEWQLLGPDRVRAVFTNAGHTISAILVFDQRSDLVNFYSDDRYQSADGKSYALYRWSTPLSEYRDFGGHRLASRGRAIWHMPSRALVYGEFELLSITYDGASGAH